MQGDDARNHRRQCDWNLRLTDVCLVLLAVHKVTMNLCVKRVAHNHDVAGKLDYRTARTNLDVCESMD